MASTVSPRSVRSILVHRSRFLGLLLLLLVLTGCSASSGEKQIFPICMSMDRLEDGRLQLAVQVSDMSGEKATEYTVFVAAGDSFGQTLEILGASMPYPLHFGQLRLCLVEYELAAQEELQALLEPVSQLYTINPETAVMVCMGDAAKTMAAQKPDLGVRLSTYLDQLLARLRQEKLAPPETLRDVMSMLKSGYRDPLLGLCAVNAATGPDDAAGGGGGSSGGNSSGGGGESQAAFNPTGSIAIGEPSPGDNLPAELTAGSLPRKGGNPVEYIGCATVGKGRVTGTLTALETRLGLTLREAATISGVTSSGAQVQLPRNSRIQLAEAVQLVTKWQLLRCDALGVIASAARKSINEADFTASCKNLEPSELTLTITYE